MTATSTTVAPSRLRPGDVLRVGSLGLRTRKLRTALSALGITIGIAAMVGVLGLSESSRAQLLNQLDSLGTNLLVITAGTGIGGSTASGTAASSSPAIPSEAPGMVRRIGPVESLASTIPVSGNVYRNPYVSSGDTGGLSVVAATDNLVTVLNGSMTDGRFLDDALGAYPNTVLGSVAAQRLGINHVDGTQRVWLAGQWFTVVGIMDHFPLAEDIDRSAVIGTTAASTYLGTDVTSPSTMYVRTNEQKLDDVRTVLPATVNPGSPDRVSVSRPSDALAAKAAAQTAFTALFLGLGAVALLVGGIGIANVMVIAVIERRNEIGLRRALGATRAHIRRQFLTEALLLAALGGVGGVLFGALATAVYGSVQQWPIVVPLSAVVGGIVAALLIGAIAGLYPAMRAARLAPTEALRSA
ncbi:MAG: ABC transporter permease [Acidimicrobiales bacterium]